MGLGGWDGTRLLLPTTITHRSAIMPRKPQVAVEPRPNGRWAVQTDGTTRADSLHDRKSDAVQRARELASNKQTELVIKTADGKIAQKDSHGNDPRGNG
jgi:hypothetical protein